MKDIFDWSNNWGIDFNVSKCRIVTFVKNIYIKNRECVHKIQTNLKFVQITFDE